MGRHSPTPGRRRAGGPLAAAGLAGSGVAIVVGGLGLAGAFHGSAVGASQAADTGAASRAAASTPPATTSAPQTASPPTSPSTSQNAAAAVRPVTLQIPAISVSTAMEQLGVADDGTLQTPTDPLQAGWFTGSSLPGRPGPVVIAGHVDSVHGPAVFAHLKKIKAGDLITVALSDGSHVTYTATSVVDYAKANFPSQDVYGPRPDSELRLITCGGAFVKGEYVDNVVVYARLTTPQGT